jgi:hypothetical protein
MSNSFEFNNYSVLSSLNERTIYIKAIDKITFMCYEHNVEAKELRLSIDLNDTYTLITKCFQKEENHNVNININSGAMKMTFSAIVGGYLNIHFEIMLREKIMSNDSQLTMNFHRIEQTQQQAIQQLTQRLAQLEDIVEAVSYAEICMLQNGVGPNSRSDNIFYKLNSKSLTLTGSYLDLLNIRLFYQLEKLVIQSCTTAFSAFNSNELRNKTLKELVLIDLTHGNFTSVIGLKGFPNLENLTITNCPHLTDLTSVLSSYKNKIKHIKIKSCASINNTELLTYCQKMKIPLEMT